jgi:hypothetical protein
MKKKLVILAMVALIALGTASTAMAGASQGQGSKHGRQLFALVGTITAIGSDTITVQVVDGNRFVWPYIGQGLTLTVQVTDSTRFFEWTPDGRVPITLADVAESDTTSIHGTVANDVFTANWVTVDVPCVTP